MASGVFRKKWNTPIRRRAIYRDEGTTSEGEGPAPATGRIMSSLANGGGLAGKGGIAGPKGGLAG